MKDSPFQKVLEEVGNTTMVRGKADKRAALAGKNAMGLVKEQNPALYKKYVLLNRKRMQLKEMIMKKYGPMAAAMARKQMK